MRILWIIELEYEFKLRHGANLRFFNLARELIGMGHQVYFATHRRPIDDAIEKQRYLSHLVDQQVISGHLEVAYAPPVNFRRFGQLAVSPGLANRLLRRFQEPVCALVEEFIARKSIDLCIVSSRALLFLVPAIGRTRPVFIDWIDSFVLFFLRQAGMSLKQRKFAMLPYAIRRLGEAFVDERYYGKRSRVNLVVSPVDKRCLDLVNGKPERNCALLNGVTIRDAWVDVAPLRNQLIFSGNMSFRPNCEGAIWFIDFVLPLLLRRRPDIVFVAAGANPPDELLARRSAHVRVTGFVEDLEREIAESTLYVAPLVSGGGFKNKVVEAISAGRYVVATSRAVEFLDPSVRCWLLVADTPAQMAEHILAYLENPSGYGHALRTLRRILGDTFTWERRAEEFLRLALENVPLAITGPAVQGAFNRVRVSAAQAHPHGSSLPKHVRDFPRSVR